jgi:hypothetical protein
MTMYFSRTTLGFYDSAVSGDNIPADAVEITTERHADMLRGQTEGWVIDADENGAPYLRDPAPPTAESQWRAYQTKAKDALTASDTSMLRIYEAVILGDTTMESPDVVAFVKWRQEVRAILSAAQPDELPTDLPTMPAYPVGTGTPSTNSSTTTTDTTSTEAQS